MTQTSGVFALGSTVAALSPSIMVSLKALGVLLGATIPVPWLIRGTTLKRVRSRLATVTISAGLAAMGSEYVVGLQNPLPHFFWFLVYGTTPWLCAYLSDIHAYEINKDAETKTRDPDTVSHDTGLTDAAAHGSMPDNESEGSQEARARTVWWCILASLVSLGPSLFFKTFEGPKNPPEALLTSMPLIAVVFGALALVVYHRSGGREAMAGPSGVVATSGVITWSLAEAVAIAGLVAATLMAYPLSFLPYALASLALLIWTRPPAG